MTDGLNLGNLITILVVVVGAIWAIRANSSGILAAQVGAYREKVEELTGALGVAKERIATLEAQVKELERRPSYADLLNHQEQIGRLLEQRTPTIQETHDLVAAIVHHLKIGEAP